MVACFSHFFSMHLFYSSNQDHSEKKWSIRHQSVLFNVWNDEFVDGLIILDPGSSTAVTFPSVHECLVCRCYAFILFNFWKLIFHTVIYGHLWGVLGSVLMNLLQISCLVYQWKNFENGQYVVKIYTQEFGVFLWLTVYALTASYWYILV